MRPRGGKGPAAGRADLPHFVVAGGALYRAAGLGTLIVKPERHVTAVADLTDAEAAEPGPLLRDASRVARQVVAAEQVYNCLWSHAGGVPVHIHYMVQPVTREQMAGHDSYGPGLQVRMFTAGAAPPEADIGAMAEQARRAFASVPIVAG